MQGFNKYYPPDYEPDKHKSLNSYHGKHALGKRAHKVDQGILVVRFELPFNIWCDHCKAHIGQGVRYNAEKQKVGNYYSTPIWAFRFKCHLCSGRIEIRTDPQNTAYVVTEGAKQKNEQWDPAENGQMVIDNSVSNNEAPPDPFASLEKDVTQKARALSESERLTALFEKNDSHWSDPYTASYALRASFREKKRVRLESEAKAEEVKSRFGLGDRARIEDLKTPKPGSEEAAWEKREWERAKGEMVRVKEERESKRRREEEQAGWKVSTDQVSRSKDAERKKRSRSSIDQPQREAGTSSSSSLSSRSRRYSEPTSSSRQTASSKPTSTTRQIASLPKSRSFSSALISTKSASPNSTRANPALQALHSKLSLATALKQDPFAAKPASSPPALPSSASCSALGSSSGVRLVKKP
ncbi:hypothetical protein JCM8115_003002 [Rhodotorula mucilaginosa]